MGLYLFMNTYRISTQMVRLIKDGFSAKLFDPGSISERKCDKARNPRWLQNGTKKGKLSCWIDNCELFPPIKEFICSTSLLRLCGE